MKLYLTARSTNEWDDYSSRVIVVEMTKARLAWIKRMAKAARKLGASEIRFYDYTPVWHGGFDEQTGEPHEAVTEANEIRTECDELAVAALFDGDVAFYYDAYFKNGDGDKLQTDWVYVSNLPLTPPWEEKAN